MRIWATLLVSLFLAGCPGADEGAAPGPELQAPEASPGRGWWVLAEGSWRTLESPRKIDQLVADAERLGVTDLFVQIYRGGRSWFPSQSADAAPYREILQRGAGAPLPRLIEAAHARGIRVHAWFNVLRVAKNRDAPLLAAAGPDALLVDREGRSLADYPNFEVPLPDRRHARMGSPGLWLDPATPGVIEHLESPLDELVASTPEFDGLHLDFIRHPLVLPIVPGSRFEVGLEFGYGEPGRTRFEQETGRGFRRGEQWDAFRRERVDETVRRLSARVPEHWAVSAAVLPWAERAYLAAMQDWRRWLEEGWLDFVVAMAYTRDDRLLRYLSHGLTGGIGGDRVWLGLGSWLFAEQPARGAAQVATASGADPAGIVLFSYDALAGRADLLDEIAAP